MGCATTSHHDTRIDLRLTPPLPDFQAKWRNSSVTRLKELTVGANENNISWWRNYLIANGERIENPQVSCDLYKSLSEVPEFVLNDLALLRAHETCPASTSLAPLPSTVAPWYREIFADLKLKEAEQSQNESDQIRALIEKAQLDDNKKRKEDFYEKALALAKKLNLPSESKNIEGLLFKNSPRLNPTPLDKDMADIAMDQRYHREFDEALATYKKILSKKGLSSDEEFQTLKSIRQTNKVAQRRHDYINATADLVAKTKKDFLKNKKDRKAIQRFHDAQVLFARTLWTEDQTSRAVRTLKETRRLLLSLYPMDEVLFTLGRIEEEKGHFESALDYYEASYQQPVSYAGLRDKIVWLKSWNYYKLGKWSQAQKSFEEMKVQVKEPSDIARARFWLARTLEKTGDTATRETELQTLATEDSLGYYGVLAVRELKQDFPPVKVESSEDLNLDLLQVREVSPQTRLTIEWLISVNEKSFSEKVLNAAANELKQKNVSDEGTWLAVASGYARSGLYLPLFSTIGGLKPEIKDRLLQNHPQLLFPQPFASLIKEASDKSDVPQELIYSIMRQESAFNPEARSPADAFGLMQLLPSVARELAKRYKLEFKTARDLFNPEIIIPLGAFELKSLLSRYDDQFILAVSGYNANDSAIKGWLKTRYRPDSIEFIEEVPYEETRTYIKLVMRNYVFYQRLLSPQKPTAFPENLLKLKKPLAQNN